MHGAVRPIAGGLQIERAAYRYTGCVEHVGVDHGRRYIRMPEEFLHGTDVIAGFEQMGREGMTQRMTVHLLADSGFTRGLPNCFLQPVFMDVMTPNLAAARIDRQAATGKDVLPNPFPRRVGILSGERAWQKHLTMATLRIFLENLPDMPQMFPQRVC